MHADFQRDPISCSLSLVRSHGHAVAENRRVEVFNLKPNTNEQRTQGRSRSAHIRAGVGRGLRSMWHRSVAPRVAVFRSRRALAASSGSSDPH